MIAQISAVNMEAELGNLKTVVQAKEFPSCEASA